jgi:hypothetical protein
MAESNRIFVQDCDVILILIDNMWGNGPLHYFAEHTTYQIDDNRLRCKRTLIAWEVNNCWRPTSEQWKPVTADERIISENGCTSYRQCHVSNAILSENWGLSRDEIASRLQQNSLREGHTSFT